MNIDKKATVLKLFNSFDRFSKLNWNHSPVSNLKRSEIFTLFSIKRIMNNESSSVKVSDISRILDVAPPTVTQLINGLEVKGHVKRSINEKDRRSVRINLTEKGLHAIDEASAAFYKYFEGLADYMGVEKCDELARLLSTVYDYFKSLEKESANGGFVL